MVIEFVILLICFVLFLFTLYVLSKEDFVFLRKNITIEDIYNVAFITAFIAILFARLGYVIFNFDPSFLNPLIFFLIPYFPGMSLLGGVIGGIIASIVLTKRKKFPQGRFLDFFAYSFLSVLPIGYAGYVLTGINGSIYFAVTPILYFSVLFFFFMKMLLPRFLQGQMKDGMLGLLVLMNYALFTLIISLIRAYHEKSSLLTLQNGTLGVLFLVCLFFYVKQGAFLQMKRK